MSDAYKQGFKDGFQAGVEAARIISLPPLYTIPPQPVTLPNRCHVCGLDLTKPMGYVCYNNNCPTQTRVTS